MCTALEMYSSENSLLMALSATDPFPQQIILCLPQHERMLALTSKGNAAYLHVSFECSIGKCPDLSCYFFKVMLHIRISALSVLLGSALICHATSSGRSLGMLQWLPA